VLLMGLLLYGFCFFSLTAFNILSVLCASYFNDNMLWGSYILANCVWRPGGFLYQMGRKLCHGKNEIAVQLCESLL
jgi:hypothetical protein